MSYRCLRWCPAAHATLALFLVTTALTGCATKKVPLTDLAVPVPIVPIPGLPILGPGEDDLRFMRWERSFEKLHARLQKEYPYTEWKGIDWGKLHEEYAPRVSAAHKNHDEEAWYLALRDYLYQIPDANVGIGYEEVWGADEAEGNLGLHLRRLDDGTVVVADLEGDGPARKAGMHWGAVLESWDGQPVDDALAGTSLRWASSPASTHADRDRIRLEEIVHVAPGASVRIRYRNPDAAEPSVATLTAVETREKDDFLAGLLDTPLDARVLPEGPGYLKLDYFSSSLTTPFPARAFARDLDALLEASVPAIILDLRGNAGGAIDVATAMTGHFISWEEESPPVLLRHIARGESTDDIRTVPVTPAEPHVDLPCIVLVDGETSGIAEAFARFLRNRGARIAGSASTRGSLSNAGVMLTLPRGYSVYYPTRRALDTEGKIIVESDASGQGGVAPDIHVPVTMATLHEIRDGGDPVLRAAVEALTVN